MDPVIYYPFNKIRALISGSGVCVVCVVCGCDSICTAWPIREQESPVTGPFPLNFPHLIGQTQNTCVDRPSSSFRPSCILAAVQLDPTLFTVGCVMLYTLILHSRAHTPVSFPRMAGGVNMLCYTDGTNEC